MKSKLILSILLLGSLSTQAAKVRAGLDILGSTASAEINLLSNLAEANQSRTNSLLANLVVVGGLEGKDKAFKDIRSLAEVAGEAIIANEVDKRVSGLVDKVPGVKNVLGGQDNVLRQTLVSVGVVFAVRSAKALIQKRTAAPDSSDRSAS